MNWCRVIAILSLFFAGNAWAADDVSLFDGSGRTAAYVSIDNDLTIYLWDGKPVAYLEDRQSGYLHVWGFNGKHLGWLERGVIWVESGDGVCATKEALPGIAQLEPLKSLKELRPLKSLKELPPLKPLYTNRFSRIPCAIWLASGAS